jgi:hypothetical protein
MTKLVWAASAVIFLVGFASPGFAAPPASTDVPAATPPATPASAQPKPTQTAKNRFDPNQVICKQEEDIGTRLGGHKTCMTRAEWAHQAQNAHDETNSFQSNHSGH